ncbi:MAG TPA: sigma-70 family RNA polymerase sigma factor [Spirochaetes bacterium]|nr:sigma-70 family RNA polymerase sigma factor [Spirochaetota bacterium]
MEVRDDIAILDLLRDDPDRGMAALAESYYGRVLNLCFSFAGDEDEARDLAQEVFIKVFTSLKGFKGKSSLSTWIYRVTVNACIDTARKMKRNRTVPLDENAPAEGPREVRCEASEPVREAIARLPLRYRTVVILREIEGRSYREMADILGCSIGTIESRLHRGRDMLRKLLAPWLRRMSDEM